MQALQKACIFCFRQHEYNFKQQYRYIYIQIKVVNKYLSKIQINKELINTKEFHIFGS